MGKNHPPSPLLLPPLSSSVGVDVVCVARRVINSMIIVKNKRSQPKPYRTKTQTQNVIAAAFSTRAQGNILVPVLRTRNVTFSWKIPFGLLNNHRLNYPQIFGSRLDHSRNSRHIPYKILNNVTSVTFCN